MNKSLNKVIAVVGPTASGKTKYSIELAKQVDGEIISADSRLVYKDFNIGTAKPTAKEMSGIAHYMIDIVEPEKDYSVGLYVKQAELAIDKIIKRGKTPIVVGGTGLYINALLMNYNLPKAEPDYLLREKLYNDDYIYSRLMDLDPETAKTIEPNDRKKIIRALEVIMTTGQKISKSKNEPKYDIQWIGKNYNREELYERINSRVDEMIKMGLVDETKYLLKKHGRIPNLINTIGYQEIIEYLDNKCSLEEAIEKLKQNTRRYAKRQLTWFRRNKDIKWDVYPETLKK